MTLKSRQLDAIRDELRARLSLAHISAADELDLVLALIDGCRAMYLTARDNGNAEEMHYQRTRGALLIERRNELLMAMDEEALALRFGAQRAA